MTTLFVRNENESHNPKEAMDFLCAVFLLMLWIVDETCNDKIPHC
jgi:hypothetical protein